MAELPSEEEFKAVLNRLLDEKKYEEAAEGMVLYALVKSGPEMLAKLVKDAVEEYLFMKKQGYTPIIKDGRFIRWYKSGGRDLTA